MSRFDLLSEKEMELAEFVFATITWVQGSWRLHCNRIGTGAYKSTSSAEPSASSSSKA